MQHVRVYWCSSMGGSWMTDHLHKLDLVFTGLGQDYQSSQISFFKLITSHLLSNRWNCLLHCMTRFCLRFPSRSFSIVCWSSDPILQTRLVELSQVRRSSLSIYFLSFTKHLLYCPKATSGYLWDHCPFETKIKTSYLDIALIFSHNALSSGCPLLLLLLFLVDF